MQWMVDYLCYNFIDDKYDDGTHVCHSCGCDDLEDEPDDQLFKCSGKGNDGKGCNRYSHHRYDCSKAGTHGPKLDVDSNKHPDLPADAKCEGMWCCWECMFNKGMLFTLRLSTAELMMTRQGPSIRRRKKLDRSYRPVLCSATHSTGVAACVMSQYARTS